MSDTPTPIGAPNFGLQTDERRFSGRSGWSLPRRAASLAPLLKVEVVSIRTESRRLGTREHLTVRVRGLPRDLSRYWRRIDEIFDATKRPRVPVGRWSLRALLEYLSPWS